MSAKDIEQLARVAVDTAYVQPVEGAAIDDATARAIVRAVLRAMRDQPSIRGLGAMEKALDQPLPAIRIEPMQTQIRAYIDTLLAE